MQIGRITRHFNSDYTTISNTICRDKRASMKARGFYLTVMSLPPWWDFTVAGMVSILKESESAVYSVIDELATLGYCKRTRIRDRQGRMKGWHYDFGDPILLASEPYRGFPDVDNPDVENRGQLSTDLINSSTKRNSGPNGYVRVGDEYIGTGDDFFANLEDVGPRNGEQGLLLDIAIPEKQPKDPIPDTAYNQMYALCYLAETVQHVAFLDSRQRGRIASVLGKLRDAGADLTHVSDFKKWWDKTWMAKERGSGQYLPPRAEQVQEYWVVAMATLEKEKKNEIKMTQTVSADSPYSMENIEKAMRNAREEHSDG